MNRDGWTRLEPGIYDDRAGGVHVDINEVIREAGFTPTPENRRAVLEGIHRVCSERGLPLVEVADDDRR